MQHYDLGITLNFMEVPTTSHTAVVESRINATAGYDAVSESHQQRTKLEYPMSLLYLSFSSVKNVQR